MSQARTDELDERAVREAMECGPRALLAGAAPGAASETERVEVTVACAANGGDPGGTAESLGISRATLYRRLDRLGLRLQDFRSDAEEGESI